MVATKAKMGGNMAKPRKELSKQEKQTPRGKFAMILIALLKERGWSTSKLAERLKKEEPGVRKWTRGESAPRTIEDWQDLGKALDTAEHPFPDYRQLLPPPK